MTGVATLSTALSILFPADPRQAQALLMQSLRQGAVSATAETYTIEKLFSAVELRTHKRVRENIWVREYNVKLTPKFWIELSNDAEITWDRGTITTHSEWANSDLFGGWETNSFIHVATDIRIDTAELEKTLTGVERAEFTRPADRIASSTTSGRPALTIWEPALIEMARVVYEEKVPATQADMARIIADWAIKNGHRLPSETQLKKRVREFYKRLNL